MSFLTALFEDAGSQDEEILMLQKLNHLALWRFPASLQQPINTASASQNPKGTSPDSAASDSIRQASSATASTSAAALPDLARSTEPKETDPQLLAYTVLRFKAYSTSRSPDGRLIAAGMFSIHM